MLYVFQIVWQIFCVNYDCMFIPSVVIGTEVVVEVVVIVVAADLHTQLAPAEEHDQVFQVFEPDDPPSMYTQSWLPG